MQKQSLVRRYLWLPLFAGMFLLAFLFAAVFNRPQPETRPRLDAAIAAYEREDYKEAVKQAIEAIRDDARDADAYYIRGMSHYALQEYTLALPDFAQVITFRPDRALGYYGRGMTYAVLQQPDPALQDLSRAIELDPTWADAHYRRGVLYLDRGEYAAAIADFREELRLYPWHERVEFMQTMIERYTAQPTAQATAAPTENQGK